MRALLAATLASVLAGAQGRPLITKANEWIYDKYGILQEACSTAYKNADVDAALARVQEVPEVRELRAAVDKQVGVVMEALPPQVMSGAEEAQVMALQVKATMLEYMAIYMLKYDAGVQKADEGATAAVEKLETWVPSMKDAGVFEFLISSVYVFAVAFVSLKIALFVLGVAKSIFCFCCCCGCCCRARKAPKGQP